jgi:hypothetical protein
VVAGRVGANQANSPFRNPFGAGTLCQNASGSVGQFSAGTTGSCGSMTNPPAAGCPDGYSQLTTGGVPWNNGITVWRNNKYSPVFDSAYIYRISPYTTNMSQSFEVMNGSTVVGTAVQQWASWDGIPQKFTLVADGSAWRIAMTADLTKCIDLAGSGSSPGNGTKLQLNNCQPGDTSQMFTITPDAPTGAFFLKNVQSGRCLDEPGSNTASGVQLDIWDCFGGNNQKWNIQAYSATN